MSPVESINGKMAPVSVKVTNSPDGQHLEVPGFWYGYKRPGIRVNRFGIRTIRRNLVTHPYTSAEDENRTLFTISLQVVYAALEDNAKRQLCNTEFLEQNRYTTLIGFAVANTRANGGQWPSRWTP